MTALCLPVLKCPVEAATINPNGNVYIDRGVGYEAVTSPVSAKGGDIVMAMVGGSATITYDNGCLQKVDVGAVVVVAEVPPCFVENVTTQGIDYSLAIGTVAVAGGIAAAVALSGDSDPPASP